MMVSLHPPRKHSTECGEGTQQDYAAEGQGRKAGLAGGGPTEGRVWYGGTLTHSCWRLYRAHAPPTPMRTRTCAHPPGPPTHTRGHSLAARRLLKHKPTKDDAKQQIKQPVGRTLAEQVLYQSEQVGTPPTGSKWIQVYPACCTAPSPGYRLPATAPASEDSRKP